jgi:hypothetical protein
MTMALSTNQRPTFCSIERRQIELNLLDVHSVVECQVARPKQLENFDLYLVQGVLRSPLLCTELVKNLTKSMSDHHDEMIQSNYYQRYFAAESKSHFKHHA